MIKTYKIYVYSHYLITNNNKNYEYFTKSCGTVKIGKRNEKKPPFSFHGGTISKGGGEKQKEKLKQLLEGKSEEKKRIHEINM